MCQRRGYVLSFLMLSSSSSPPWESCCFFSTYTTFILLQRSGLLQSWCPVYISACEMTIRAALSLSLSDTQGITLLENLPKILFQLRRPHLHLCGQEESNLQVKVKSLSAHLSMRRTSQFSSSFESQIKVYRASVEWEGKKRCSISSQTCRSSAYKNMMEWSFIFCLSSWKKTLATLPETLERTKGMENTWSLWFNPCFSFWIILCDRCWG